MFLLNRAFNPRTRIEVTTYPIQAISGELRNSEAPKRAFLLA